MVDERTRQVIEHGRRIRTVLTQPEYEPLSVALQAALLVAIEQRLIDRLPMDKVRELQAKLRPWLNERAAEHVRQINETGELEDGARAAFVIATTELIERLIPPPPSGVTN